MWWHHLLLVGVVVRICGFRVCSCRRSHLTDHGDAVFKILKREDAIHIFIDRIQEYLHVDVFYIVEEPKLNEHFRHFFVRSGIFFDLCGELRLLDFGGVQILIRSLLKTALTHIHLPPLNFFGV